MALTNIVDTIFVKQFEVPHPSSQPVETRRGMEGEEGGREGRGAKGRSERDKRGRKFNPRL